MFEVMQRNQRFEPRPSTLTIANRKLASAKFRKKGGFIESNGSILRALTPDIYVPGQWEFRWVFDEYVPKGLPGYMSITAGHYYFMRPGMAKAIQIKDLYLPSLFAAKWAGAKLKASMPLDLP